MMPNRGMAGPRRGGGSHGRNAQRGGYRDGSRGPSRQQPTLPAHVSPQSENVQLLKRILSDDDDSSRRNAMTQQLIKIIEDLRQSDIHLARQECVALAEECLFHPEHHGVKTIFENQRIHHGLKQSIAKLIAVLACTTRINVIFEWLFDCLSRWQTNDGREDNRSKELKCWLLRTVKQVMTEASPAPYYNSLQHLRDCSTWLAKHLISFLNTMDSSDYLTDVLQVLETYATLCPDGMSDNFQDITDLLVGWHIDAGLSEPKRLLIQDVYVKLRPFWQTRLPFAFELLCHFLNDMTEMINTALTGEAPVDKNTCEGLFSCFNAISQAVVPLLSTPDGRRIADEISFVFDNLRSNLLQFLWNAKQTSPGQMWMDQSNQILLLFISIRPYSFRTQQWDVYNYFASQLTDAACHHIAAKPDAYLKALMKIVDAWESDLEDRIIIHMLDCDHSPLFILREKFKDDKRLNAGILVLIRVIIRMCTKNDTQAPMTKRLVERVHTNMQTIDQAYGRDADAKPLMRVGQLIRQGLGPGFSSFPSKHMCTDESRVTEAVVDSLFINYLLLDAATVWPSARTQHILLVLVSLCVSWRRKCGDIFDACLQIIKDYWTSCRFMLSSPEQFQILAAVLQDVADHWTMINLRSRQLACDFTNEILQTLLTSTTPIESHVISAMQDLVIALLRASAEERNISVKETIIRMTAQYCKRFGSAKLVDLAITHVLRGINDPCQTIQTLSIELLSVLNPFITASTPMCLDPVLHTLQTVIMATPHTGTFRPVHYEIAMAHLGMSDLLLGQASVHLPASPSDAEPSLAWAERLFHHCDALGNMQQVNHFAELKQDVGISSIVYRVNSSESLLSYWVMWESARYCILSRLRTPFGGPQQTLAAYERMLNELVSSDVRDEKVTNRLVWLLLLLDRLEVQIYNAAHGSATNALPPVPRSSLAFFRTNKKTCNDYFAKMRPNLIKGAQLVHNDPLLIRQSLEMLADYESNFPDKQQTNAIAWFETTNALLRDLVEACIRMCASDLIYGIQSWFKRMIRRAMHSIPSFQEQWSFEGLVGPLNKSELRSKAALPKDCAVVSTVSWFQIGAMFASDRHEVAIQELSQLQNRLHDDPFGILSMLRKQAFDFYTCLEDYESIRKLYATHGPVVNDDLLQNLNIFASDPSQPGEPTPINTTALSDTTVANSWPVERLALFRTWLSRHGIQATPKSELEQLLQHRTRLFGENYGLTASGRTNILEIQLLGCNWPGMLQSIQDWNQLRQLSDPDAAGSVSPHTAPRTKHWARLWSAFRQIYEETTEGAVDGLSAIQLHAARIARKQGNGAIALQWLDTVPSPSFEVLYERAKVLLLNDGQEAIIKATEALSQLLITLPAEGYECLKSRVYLEVAKLLKGASDYTERQVLLDMLSPVWVGGNHMNAAQLIQSKAEVATDTLLTHSISTSALHGRSWFEYGTYHYKQGWRTLDEMAKQDATMPVILWVRREIEQALQKDNHIEQTTKTLLDMLTMYIGSELSLKEDSAFNRALHTILPNAEQDVLILVTDRLETLKGVIIERFRASVNAYFRYLSLDDETNDSGKHSTSMVMTATLRILRILVKYGSALQSVYMENIDGVRITPWKRIIPQLFARLNNPCSISRQIITKLLDRICDEYPREIIYDVIVSSTSSKTDRNTKQILNSIAGRMMIKNEPLWVSTQRMAQELEKITVLWEEKWANKIASLTFSVMEVFRKLDQETTQTESTSGKNPSAAEAVFRERYDGAFKGILSQLEKLINATVSSNTIMTPHEQWFTNLFGKRLLDAYALLQNPKSVTNYRDGWEMFVQIHSDLLIETNKVRILDLSKVSPYLTQLRSTVMGIPGQSDTDEGALIDTFASSVVVLPTKTKPKKLDLVGTDGKKYSYLFKGLEDLHLDERIMQLLKTTNGLLGEDTVTASKNLRARIYAVIPLSDHSGMIQWVNDATPLFALYKRWQRRERTAQLLLVNDKAADDLPLQRPTEIFLSKVEATLQAAGLRVTANRRHWPKSILKQVYDELVRETPSDLLAKEIWCASADPMAWLNKTQSFARSLAVMSMIGYVIGLGDRHLDNILIDYGTAEVIHIDYNVCFEKGRRLRVPELVPYRLTHNLHKALGISGVDGLFRIAAEETLRVMRKHKEVLMTLLDAFVYDPLVDWVNEAGELEERRMMDLQVNLGRIASRLVDSRSHHESQRRQATEAVDHAIEYVTHTCLESLQLTDDRSDEDGVEDVDDAKQQLTEALEQCSAWHNQHLQVIRQLQDPNLENHLRSVAAPAAVVAQLGALDDGHTQALLEFLDKLKAWATYRDATFRKCVDEIRAYTRLLEPIGDRLLIQDVCGTWATQLTDVVRNNFAKIQAEKALQANDVNRTAQELQTMEKRAYSFASGVAQFLGRVEQFSNSHAGAQKTVTMETLEAEHQRGVTLLSRHLDDVALSSLLGSISAMESFFQRLEDDDLFDMGDVDNVLGQMQKLETGCYFGCFGQGCFPAGLLTLAVSLEEHVMQIQEILSSPFNNTERQVLDCLVPCVQALYRFEEGCLSLTTVLLQGLLAAGTKAEERMDKLTQCIESADASNLLSPSMNEWLDLHDSDMNALWARIQHVFEDMNRVCYTADQYQGITINTAAFAASKKSLILCLLHETIRLYKTIPEQAWTSARIASWSLVYNTTIGSTVKSCSSVFITDIMFPFITAVCELLRQKLHGVDEDMDSPWDAETARQEYAMTLRQVAMTRARGAIFGTAWALRSKYTAEMTHYDKEIQRFQWCNAPYVQTRRPLIHNQLLTHMADSPDRLHFIAAGLESLDQTFQKLTRRIPTQSSSTWAKVQAVWKKGFESESEQCSSWANLYHTINHMENCREGFTQAMSLGKDICENLQLLMATSDATEVSPEDSGAVPLQVLQEVQHQLVTVNDMVAALRSPSNGLVPLLESVMIVEIAADNELKPAQQSAKMSMSILCSLESSLARALDTDRNDWNFAQLTDALVQIKATVEEFFTVLRTLEEFGPDKHGEGGPSETTSSVDSGSTTLRQEETSVGANTPEMGLADEELSQPPLHFHTTVSEQLAVSSTHDKDAIGPRRNADVLSIVRRIRAKLEGRDFGVTHRMTVSEQVAKTIEQAMLPDNLCAMYEGWTSWV